MMSSRSRRRLLQLAASSALGLPALRARAAGGRVLTGFPPNPTSDALTALVLQPLANRYRPELDSRLTHLSAEGSMQALRKGPDDGSEVLLAASSAMTLTPLLRAGAGNGPVADFRAVVPLLAFTFVYCVGKSVPAEVRTLADYAGWVVEARGRDMFCVPGVGSAPQLMGLAMARGMKLSLKAVAYRGAPAVHRELAGGGQPAGILPVLGARAGLASGELRALFVGSARRWPSLPAVPALAELITTEVDTTETLGFHVRASVADAKVNELNEATRSVLAAPAFAEFTRSSLSSINPLSAPAYEAELAAERRRWEQLMRSELAGIES
jgi:tripartite-type tricarboxylate transporter receptor subunit TctC